MASGCQSLSQGPTANLSQHVVRGMSEDGARGFRNGGRPPYGYVRVKVADGVYTRTKLEPDAKTAPIVQRIFRECLEGKGSEGDCAEP